MQKDTMIRKQLYITRAQDRAIKERAKREGLRESEVVREAIDRYLVDDDGGRDGPGRAFDEAMSIVRSKRENWRFGKPFRREDVYAERENRLPGIGRD